MGSGEALNIADGARERNEALANSSLIQMNLRFYTAKRMALRQFAIRTHSDSLRIEF